MEESVKNRKWNVDQYLERIHMERPTVLDREYLDQLMIHHLMYVPFENMDLYFGLADISQDLDELFDKIVLRRRGGYCFELNALVCAFLQQLGYEAWSVSCRILRGKDYISPMLHRAVLVRLDGQVYYCDVGYGGPQPAGAVPLGGERTICGERFCIEERENPWWGLDRYTSGGKREQVIEFWLTPLPASYFVPYNFYSSRSPASLFAQKRILNLRTATGSLALTGTTLTEHRDGQVLVTEAGSREELAALIREKFGIEFPAASLRWES